MFVLFKCFLSWFLVIIYIVLIHKSIFEITLKDNYSIIIGKINDLCSDSPYANYTNNFITIIINVLLNEAYHISNNDLQILVFEYRKINNHFISITNNNIKLHLKLLDGLYNLTLIKFFNSKVDTYSSTSVNILNVRFDNIPFYVINFIIYKYYSL